jgi:hypothetical protein
LSFLAACVAVAAGAAGCSVDVAGAPCADDDNCPAGQVCGAGGTCEFGSGSGANDTGRPGTGDGGSADRGPAADVPADAATDAGVDAPGRPDAADLSDTSGASEVSDGPLPDAGFDAGPTGDAGGDTGEDAGLDAGGDAGFYCKSDEDCGGARCCDGTCAPAERGCCEDWQCAGSLAGRVCKDLVCQCATEWDCLGTERVCDTSANPPTCVDGCTPAKCGQGNVCCGKNCFSGECCENADCTTPGEPTCKLIVHTCTDSCGVEAPDCGAGYLCCIDKCKKGDCCEDEDCAVSPNGKYCVANKCSQTCASDANCPGGKCCQVGPFKGTCYTGNCCDDSQCGAPETCGGGGVPWHCGCTPDATVCDGKDCGSVVDNCGETRTCGTCFVPDCCDFKCYNIKIDREHCGDCVRKCAWDEVCNAGECKPVAWEAVGDPVNPANAGIAHALGMDGTDPIVAWVGTAAALDGGAGMNSVWAHRFSSGSWRQIGASVSGLELVQSVVDLQVRSGTPQVVYAEAGGGGTIHLKLFGDRTGTWTEAGAPGYLPACSGLMSLGLAPQDYSGQSSVTFLGAGGCGIGAGYAYFNGNTWTDYQQPPPPMPRGLLTMSGSGNSDVVHDGTRALVALADGGSIYVRYWNSMPPESWVNLGGVLNSGSIPSGAGSGPPVLSMALNPGRSPIVAFVEIVSNVKTLFVKGYEPNGMAWVALGGGKVSGTAAADSPSLGMVDGLPHVAFVQMEGSIGSILVRRWDGKEWQRVGTPLTMDPATSAEAPYLVGIGKVPHVAFRQKDGLGITRIHVAKFIAP